MAKRIKNPFGKIVQIAAAPKRLFALTDEGEVFEYVEGGREGDQWAQLSTLDADNVIEADESESEEDDDD